MVCLICDRRPAVKGSGYCHNCTSKVESLQRAKCPIQPKYYLTYRDIVVGLYPNGDDKLKPRLLKRDAEHLPKRKTLDLNTYLQGFTRDEIKRFKAACLKLAA